MRKMLSGRWWLIGAMLLCATVGFFALAETTQAHEPPGEVQFVGQVQSLPPAGLVGDWTVVGRFGDLQIAPVTVTVHVSTTTIIEQNYGQVRVGAFVKVIGMPRADKSINARKIEVLPNPSNVIPVKFFGVIEQLPPSGLVGDWKVRVGPGEPISSTHAVAGGFLVTVHVSTTTTINQNNGQVRVGAFVKVEGWVLPDRTVNARYIEVMTPHVTPGQPVEFFGKIEQLPASGLIGDWMVTGRTVHVSAQTRIINPDKAKVGAFVHVKGVALADGTVNATHIEVRNDAPPPIVRYIKFYGIIQSLPAAGLIGDWTINGLTVHVTNTTVIDQSQGAPAVGKPVEVKGILNSDGTVNALKIEIKHTPNPTSAPFGKAGAVSQSSQ
jgi:hypothetical protein